MWEKCQNKYGIKNHLWPIRQFQTWGTNLSNNLKFPKQVSEINSNLQKKRTNERESVSNLFKNRLLKIL